MAEAQHSRRRKRRRRQRALIAVIVIVLIVIVVAVTFITRRYSSNSSYSDYAEYYGLTSGESVMINYDEEVLSDKGLYLDGEVYLPYDLIHSTFNSRIYWDSNEQVLRYVLPEGIVDTSSETPAYTIAKESYTWDYPIVHVIGDQMYLSVSFLAQYTDIRYSFYEDPNRVVISDEWGDETVTLIQKSTEVRELGGNKSPILTKLSKNDPVYVIDEMDTWSEVCTEDGFVGYVKNRYLGGNATITYTSDYEEPVFTHRLKDYTICMAWHQTTSQAANDLVASVLDGTKGINVISPTWFYLNDNDGGIASLASADYVSYCHQNGIEVWALISNLENPDVDSTEVLSTTSKRDELINNIMSEAVKYDLDGINVDFESLEGEAGTGFLEFIRELSLKCAANNMVLSIDNYPPASYNMFYSRSEQAVFADYVVLMAYDEHYNGSDEGSVASIGFVRQSVNDTLEEVPADQLILGIPLYTRLWKLTMTSDGYDISSEALGMTDAENRVAENGASFTWLEDAGQYYASYQSGGSTYEIWLEDQTSIDLKLSVMKEDGLAGCSFWKLGYEKSSIWETVTNYLY